jgi:hypothetical protein
MGKLKRDAEKDGKRGGRGLIYQVVDESSAN